MAVITYREAVARGIAQEMRRDPKVFYMSTDALPHTYVPAQLLARLSEEFLILLACGFVFATVAATR